MPLDQVRTQVLLLHSEQSTLDNLSSGLGDRFTVHCATSGTEALNTFTETPIHVIISAQNLPGMSGVEALREAKKRSPETIGILLAGDKDEGLEALVGEKEVFQVVRGGIGPDDLVKLIDNATQQIRLLALAESANDTAANPDELTSEHIIMETSENGSTIISDGTGQVPVLDPKKVSAAAATGSQTVDVLVLTKDEEFLTTVRESSRGMHNVRYANTLAQAEDALAKYKVGVAVLDAAMIGQNVEKLALHLRRKSARLVSVVAGRRDDGEMLMDLINRGKVYRFLLKPVSPGRARLAIEASVKHHMEAPDSAFKLTGGSAPAKPAAPKAARPATATQPTPKPTPAQKQAPAAKPAVAAKTEPTIEVTVNPDDDRLAGAFDGDDSSFTETMTGIVAGIGEKFSSRGKPAEPAPTPGELPDTAPGDPGPPSGLNSRLLGIGAVAAAVLVAAGIWMFTGSDDSVPFDESAGPQGVVTEADPVFPSPSIAEPAPSIDAGDLLDEARLARGSGQLFNPPGNNALEFYAAAAQAAPDDDVIAAEFAETVDEAIAIAESALLDRDANDAAAALDRIGLVDPDNARLPFLSAQLTQMQLRNNLDAARAAIRDARFEDAATAIAAARTLDVSDVAEINAVAEELSTARSDQQVDEVLARAADRLDRGMLVSPANDNARYFYGLVLSNDPGNTAALAGLNAIAGRLVLQARGEIDAGRFDRAETLLNDARSLDPSSDGLATSTQALADARERVAAEARRREQERLAAEQRAEADRLAAQQRAEEERRAAQQQAEEERLAAEAAEAEAAAENSQSDSTDAEVVAETGTNETGTTAEAADTEAGSGDVETSAPAEELVAQNEIPAPANDLSAAGADASLAVPEAAPQDMTPVPISTLTRTKYVAPRYPRAAERRNLSGWVDVVFTVATDGTTRDIEVLNSEPGETFVNAARRAVERWEFMPVVENGTVTEKRAGVRMMFAIE